MPQNFDPRMQRIFGSGTDPIEVVVERARQAFPHEKLIVWEGDPATFAFTFVGGDAVELLGFTPDDWASSQSFWQDRVVHSADRDDAVAYCALATARCADHVFEYRALTKSFDIVWLKDYVHVVTASGRIPLKLRGLMIDITDEKFASGTFEQPAAYRYPPAAELELAA